MQLLTSLYPVIYSRVTYELFAIYKSESVRSVVNRTIVARTSRIREYERADNKCFVSGALS